MKNVNIWGLLSIFIVGVALGILGTIFFINKEEEKVIATRPYRKERTDFTGRGSRCTFSKKKRAGSTSRGSRCALCRSRTENARTRRITSASAQEKPIALKDQTDGCKGPFGVDSQKILQEVVKEGFDYRLWSSYKIGIVAKIDLSKSPDGTWRVKSFRIIDGKTFSPLYRGDYNVGDFIGYRTSITGIELLEHISSQSVDCKIDDISGLSNPSKTIPIYPPPEKEDFVSVTGVIMAVSIKKNPDPEPDNPDDFQIHEAVMKCADGNLYRVEFKSTVSRTPRINLPAHDAFGEGDVATVTQINSPSDELKSTLAPRFYDSDYRTFRAYYEKDKNSSNGQ